MKMSYYSAYNLEKYNMSSLDTIHHSEANLKLGGEKSIANHPLATQFFYSAWASLGGKMPAALKGQSREFTILGGGGISCT